jgi:hypothetical protein
MLPTSTSSDSRNQLKLVRQHCRAYRPAHFFRRSPDFPFAPVEFLRPTSRRAAPEVASHERTRGTSDLCTFQSVPSTFPIGAIHLSNRCHPPFQSVPSTFPIGAIHRLGKWGRGIAASYRETAGDGSAVYAPGRSAFASFGGIPRFAWEPFSAAVPRAHSAEAWMRLSPNPPVFPVSKYRS